MSVKTDPYTFSNGTVADALEVNARFDELYTLQNGGIDADNMDLTDDYAWTGTHTFADSVLTSTDINGGTIDNTVIGGSTPAAGSFTTGTFSDHIYLAATKRLYFDGGGDTYMLESAANNLQVYTGGTLAFSLDSIQDAYFSADVVLEATNGLYFDGGSDTRIYESAADTLTIAVGGTARAQYIGGSNLFALVNSTEMSLSDIDPPTANYANRHGIVKGWINYTDGAPGSIADSYNVDSVTDDDGDGYFYIDWDTDFASTNYVPVGNPEGTAIGTDITLLPITQAAGQTRIWIYDHGTPAAADTDFVLIAIGDQ